MSNSISRRTFLKCTGASVAALGAASLLGAASRTGSGHHPWMSKVRVISQGNWNGLAFS